MNVSEAVRRRKSVRAFLDKPVPETLLREALELAARAPSGGNLQPWRLFVLTGEPLAALTAAVQQRLQKRPQPPAAEYEIYPSPLSEPYRSSRYELGEAMYALLGIPRENKLGRLLSMQNNFRFFGAPVGLFCYVDKQMGSPQWSDLGMYLQTLMLLLQERGIDSCPQEAWSIYHDTVRELLAPPAEWTLFCGMAIGYADLEAAVNRLHSERLPLESFATLTGF
jgi:nitroreductase